MNYIHLVFDESITVLLGNDFGVKTYIEQIKNKLDFEQKNMIIFDDKIRIIAISFVKGVFSELLEKYDINEMKKIIDIKCQNKNLEKEVWEALEF